MRVLNRIRVKFSLVGFFFPPIDFAEIDLCLKDFSPWSLPDSVLHDLISRISLFLHPSLPLFAILTKDETEKVKQTFFFEAGNASSYVFMQY